MTRASTRRLPFLATASALALAACVGSDQANQSASAVTRQAIYGEPMPFPDFPVLPGGAAVALTGSTVDAFIDWAGALPVAEAQRAADEIGLSETFGGSTAA